MFYKSPDGNYMPLFSIICHLYNPFFNLLFVPDLNPLRFLSSKLCIRKDAVRNISKLCIFRNFSIEPDVFMFLEFICLFFMSRSVRTVLKWVQVRLLNTSSRTNVDQNRLRIGQSPQVNKSLLKKIFKFPTFVV